jgi:cyclopropane-fatty-acyl-phospholipid synthase
LLPHGSLTIQLPDKRVVKVGGNNPGPDAVLILHNWNLPAAPSPNPPSASARATWTATGKAPTSPLSGAFRRQRDARLPDRQGEPPVPRLQRLSALAEPEHEGQGETQHLGSLRSRQRLLSTLARPEHDIFLGPVCRWRQRSGIRAGRQVPRARQGRHRPGRSCLEIGCGWGGFAEFAAREIGCRVTGLTISREQLEFARERIRRAGLDDRVTFKFQDYRDEQSTYDRVVSIEMFEAVGEQYWPIYFSKVHDVLKPGGKAGLQIITINERAFPEYRANPDFIQRYIFPGGMLPTPQILDGLSSDHGLQEVRRTCLRAGLCAHAGDVARSLP